ncbi:MAG: transporter substrate-binding domain-containing protein [Candidatus Cloacimonetes bacterium]|nr:transporter substrate-binding domain-containing protein [Candidatus Cloacimonadota bacterium]
MKYLYSLMIVLCISLLAGIELNVEERQWLTQHPVIRIAPDPYFPPIEWLDDEGHYQGIAQNYMDVIAQELGIEFETVQCRDWDEALQKARDREIDVLPAGAKTPQRGMYMNATSPYLVFPGVIISRKDTEIFTSIETLYGKEVDIVSGYIWEEMIRLQHPEIMIKPVPSLKEGLRNVSIGEDDVIIGTLPIAIYYIQQEGITNLHITGESGYSTKLAILTRNDWPMLNRIMEKALAAIPPETKQRILGKWTAVEKIHFYQTRLFRIITIGILAGSLLVLMIIVSWNRTLKKQVKQRTMELKRLKDNLEELVTQRTAELADQTRKLTMSQEALASLLREANKSRAQLRESNVLLRNSNRELEEFAYSISHDLRAPLRSIIGFSEIISRRYKSDLNDEGQKYLNNILVAGKNMACLIEDLLLYSRLGIKSKKPVNLQDVFTKILFNLDGLIKDTGAEVSIPQDLPVILSSETLLYQIFLNLIQNGICYHQTGKKARVAVEVKKNDTEIVIAVKDNGIGIEEKYQEKIFTLFQRLHRESKHPGTGIGLAIVKKSVTALGGKIWIESKVGEGSAFYIELPMSEGGNIT